MLALAFRLARREMRGGIKGFRIFLACLALGVAAIAAAGSLNAAMRVALVEDARALLGGDMELRLSHRTASEEQLAFLQSRAAVSRMIEMRAMARSLDKDSRTLVELKGVDRLYPLYGKLGLDPALPKEEVLARSPDGWGAAADPNLLARLGLKVGDKVRIGDAVFQIRATITKEPDRVATAFNFGPRFLVQRDALAETGLIEPGSLIRYLYLLKLDPGTSPAEMRKALTDRFPDAGWQIRDAGDAAPGVQRFLDNMTVFLTLVGLTALLVGGIGVANAVKAYMDGKVATIAILKCVGAPARLIFATYFIQIALLTLLGILIGLAAGAALPNAAIHFFGDRLPIDARPGLYPLPLALSAAFGALTAVTFALWPLARARQIPAATLFRDLVARHGRPGRRDMAAIAATGTALALLAVVSAENRLLAAWFVGGAVAALLLFQAAAALLIRGARALSKRRAGSAGSAPLRLALGNLHRPGAPAASVVLSLGLGLTVLVCIALIEGNLSRQFDEQLPREAPAFFFIDIQEQQARSFDEAVASVPGAGEVKRAAMVRGRITRLNGKPVDQVAIDPSAEWAVKGDRGLTMAARQPEDARLTAGAWWPEDYAGPPLVSLDAGIAKGFHLGLGDTISVNVLGRELTATIASLREIDWSSLGMNFTFVLSPGSLNGAPHSYIAAVHARPDAEAALERAVTDRLPNVTSIRVKEALTSVKEIVVKAAVAIRSAAAVTLIAGALVLAGAIAAGQRRRVYEAVVLKVLGATRGVLWRAFLIEYGLMGAATGLIAGIVGSVAAWAVLTFVMHTHWTFLPGAAVATVLACIAATLVIGFAGTWRALGAKAAPLLRHD